MTRALMILLLLAAVSALDIDTRLQKRYEKFRSMGRLGIEFVDESAKL